MPITPFLRNQTFEPDQIDIMSAAFVDACAVLGLADRTDPATELVAMRIIELTQCGVVTYIELFERAINGFKPYNKP
jgi:hypothetical protein